MFRDERDHYERDGYEAYGRLAVTAVGSTDILPENWDDRH
jgi:hypothetical protein